jgi:putative flippase GtrA
MNKNGHEHLPRFSAVGVTTASILALIVAMALSVVFDIQPTEASTATKMAHTVSAHA